MDHLHTLLQFSVKSWIQMLHHQAHHKKLTTGTIRTNGWSSAELLWRKAKFRLKQWSKTVYDQSCWGLGKCLSLFILPGCWSTWTELLWLAQGFLTTALKVSCPCYHKSSQGVLCGLGLELGTLCFPARPPTVDGEPHMWVCNGGRTCSRRPLWPGLMPV